MTVERSREWIRDVSPGDQGLVAVVPERNRLTLRGSRRKSNNVEISSLTRYGRLRTSPVGIDALHEDTRIPPEALLQAIWRHQQLQRHKLRTVDGQPVFILHPGFLNREPGPDFGKAVIQVGDNPPKSGDVEVDPRAADWINHRHNRNPAYANVILHVVWEVTDPDQNPAQVPLLELRPWLEGPADGRRSPSQDPSPEGPPEFVSGRCKAPLRQADPQQIHDLLQEAGLFRLHARGQKLESRARDCGWTQTLWEAVFRALGYKHNAWPMLRLAELRNRFQSSPSSPTRVLARLLGTSGLLPAQAPTHDPAAVSYFRRLWDCWWRERETFSDCTFPSSIWHLAGNRPANHPQRRLALAAEWLSRNDLPDQLRHWCDTAPRDSRLPTSLREVLNPRADGFWLRHYTLRSRRSDVPIPLLGPDRVTDLAVNAVLPWLWARARQGRRLQLSREIERRYLVWPAGSENAILRLARRRLLGTTRRLFPHKAVLQQGLQQIVSDYCTRSNSLCDGCKFPEVARQFAER